MRPIFYFDVGGALNISPCYLKYEDRLKGIGPGTSRGPCPNEDLKIWVTRGQVESDRQLPPVSGMSKAIFCFEGLLAKFYEDDRVKLKKIQRWIEE